MIWDWIVAVFVLIGSGFSLLAAIGVLRMPDVYLRIQSTTKCSTLGVSCLVIAAMIHVGNVGAGVRALLIVAFLFFTAPVAAHMIARAAYASGAPLWEQNHVDEMPGKALKKVERPKQDTGD